MRTNHDETTAQDAQVSRRELRQLKWLTALVPFTVLLISAITGDFALVNTDASGAARNGHRAIS